MTTPKRKLRSNESFCGMVENLGDAYETAEECFGMIWWLADALAATGRPAGEDPGREEVLLWIRQAEDHYQDGLKLGGRQKDR